MAFSGGLDSTVLAKAAQLALGDRAVAVTGISASLAVGELDECRRLARQIGIRHEVIRDRRTGRSPSYQENTADRCYFCKTELFVKVEQRGRAAGRGGRVRRLEPRRPGRASARAAGGPASGRSAARWPSAASRRPRFAQLAAAWGLPTWDKPATPCLSSRIAYGEQVTPERLAMIDQAERFLRERGFQPLRVRYHKGDMARIEVAAGRPAAAGRAEFRREVVEQLKSLGFKYVSLDLEGFRSGSMNAVLEIRGKAERGRGKAEGGRGKE